MIPIINSLNSIHLEVTDDLEKRYTFGVLPTVVVDSSLLQIFPWPLENPAESCYYEQAFIIGKDIPTFLRSSETFAECGIKHGDTLYLLQRCRRYIDIQNELKRDEVTSHFFAPHVTISELIKTLHHTSENGISHLPVEEIALKYHDEFLSESKTLADYHNIIWKDSKLHLCMKGTKISIGVPMYTKMEQILFKPGDTIADLKNEVKMKTADLEFSAVICEAYPVPLRGAVKDEADGYTSYLYLDLFCKEMHIFICQYEPEHTQKQWLFSIYSFLLDSEFTVNDIRVMIKREHDRHPGRFYEFYRSRQLRRCSMYHVFNEAWVQTFAPQIEAQPLSSNMSIPLFFFPVRIEMFQHSVPALSAKVAHIISSFCEQKLGIKGVSRLMYHTQTEDFLNRSKVFKSYVEQHASGAEPNSFILTKRVGEMPHRGRRIKIQIRWHMRTGNVDHQVHFMIHPTDTINHLQDQIEDDLKVPFFMQKLMFNGQCVQGKSTIHELGIIEDSILDLQPLLDNK